MTYKIPSLVLFVVSSVLTYVYLLQFIIQPQMKSSWYSLSVIDRALKNEIWTCLILYFWEIVNHTLFIVVCNWKCRAASPMCGCTETVEVLVWRTRIMTDVGIQSSYRHMLLIFAWDFGSCRECKRLRGILPNCVVLWVLIITIYWTSICRILYLLSNHYLNQIFMNVYCCTYLLTQQIYPYLDHTWWSFHTRNVSGF